MNDNSKIWDLYIKTKDPALREKLILEYVPIVKYVAGRLSMQLYGHVEYEDMVSYGIFGLIDAIDKFDAEKGVKFETYASLRIRGTILDNVRKLDWVPRTVRQENKKIEQAYHELEGKLGREPSDEELSEKLSLTLEETQELIKKNSLSAVVSLDDYLENNNDMLTDSNKSDSEPESEFLKREATAILSDAINKLSERERLVITLYYYENFTLKEVSKIMKVSESRVSQIHSKAVFKLRVRLGKYVTLFNF